VAETVDPADQPSVERSCSNFLATISAEQPVDLGACKPLFKHLRNHLRRFVIRGVREKDPLRLGHLLNNAKRHYIESEDSDSESVENFFQPEQEHSPVGGDDLV